MAYTLGVILGRLIFVALVMLVVGGVYYLLARPRVTLRQAIFRWWIVLIGVVLLLLSVVAELGQSAGG